MKYQVNKMLYCQFTDEGLAIVAPQEKLLVLNHGDNEMLVFLEVFLRGKTLGDGFNEMSKKLSISKRQFDELVRFSLKKNILKQLEEVKPEYDTYFLEKYSRQINAFEAFPNISLSQALKMQHKLSSSTVVIVGVGGVGSYLATSLAMMGVEKLILVDNDSVELSNTSRQILYTEKDIGKSKVALAKQKLPLYNRELHVDAHQIFVKSVKDLAFLRHEKQVDLIINCSDEPRGEIQGIIDELATEIKTAWLHCGPFNQTKVILGPLFIPGETKPYQDRLKNRLFDKDKRVKAINSRMHSGMFASLNGIAAKMATVETLKFLTNYAPVAIKDRCFILETNDWSVESYEI